MLARLEVNLPPPHRLPSVRLCLGSKHPEPSTLSLSLNPHLHQPVCTSALNPQTSQLICISLPKTRISEQSDASSQSSPAGNSVLMSFCTIYVTYGALWLFFFFQWVIYALLLIWETISHFGLFLALTFNCEFALLCFNLKLSRCWGEGGVSTILFHIELDTWRGVMKETLLWNTTGITEQSQLEKVEAIFIICVTFSLGRLNSCCHPPPPCYAMTVNCNLQFQMANVSCKSLSFNNCQSSDLTNTSANYE